MMGPKRIVALALPVLFSMALLAQTVIDATVPIHKRLRNPTAGQGGSIGRKLPIQISLEFPPEKNSSNGVERVMYVLTNTGHTNLAIPTSPHAGDFEPRDPNAPYTVQHLHLYLTWSTAGNPALPEGADLYGNQAHHGTLLTLSPGKSVRVLARLRVPRQPSPAKGQGASVIAHAVLDQEALKTVRGQTTINSNEIASSSSPEYKLELP